MDIRTPRAVALATTAIIVVVVIGLIGGEALIGVLGASRAIGRVLLMLLAIVGITVLLTWSATTIYIESTRRRRRRERRRDELAALEAVDATALAAASDPMAIARADAPETLGAVEEALATIARLRGLDSAHRTERTAEALAMVDGWMRTMLENHARTAHAATDVERRTMARAAVGAVIDVARIAEEARADAVKRVDDRISTDARYIAAKAGDVRLGPAE